MANDDKKRVGILTLYYNNKNYGGQLQAYALRKAIENLGMEAKQISFVNKTKIAPPKDKISLQSVPKKIINKIVNKLTEKNWTKDKSLIDKLQLDFSDDIPHTRAVDEDSIASIADDFDEFVCGSDQIWNPGCSASMFFDFVPDKKKKISYAASLGREHTPKEHYERMKQYLERFDAISVREECHRKGLTENCDLDNVELMPDPVFLFSAEEWHNMYCSNCMDIENKDKYIFLYLLGDNISIRNKCVLLAKNSGYSILYVPYLNRNPYLWDKQHSSIHVQEPTVWKFLYLIEHAEAVITDSFHGAAFSIIFGKKLVALKRFKKNDSASINSRIETLFNNAKLNYTNFEKIPGNIGNISSAEAASLYLPELKSKGIRYLKANL